MKKIQWSNHAIEKLEVLKIHGFQIEKSTVEKVIIFPNKIESTYKERKVAQKDIDETHVLRVIYEDRKDDILIITFYPGRKERYEKN